jgi:uncharacterized protein YijF (DUF1287 family)
MAKFQKPSTALKTSIKTEKSNNLPKISSNPYVKIPDEYSKNDNNHNGIPDAIDLVNGARKEVKSGTKYVDSYYVGGYPPQGEGVCTDVIWRAFKEAGIDLKTLIDNDIAKNTGLYKGVNGKPDPNIDFRRVLNQDVFFSRYCKHLTTDLNANNVENLKQWQSGDIVVFIEGYEHIAIVSDKRDEDGIPYVIHNVHPHAAEAKLSWFHNPIHGHYRWNF